MKGIYVKCEYTESRYAFNAYDWFIIDSNFAYWKKDCPLQIP